MAEKGTVVVGCDRNSGQDATFQNTVCSKLESAGYTVEKLPIAPNPFAQYSYSSKAQGKYGVYIIADGTYSIADYHYGANKNKKSFKMAVFPIRTDLKKKLQGDDWDDIPVGADADYSNLPRDIVGKTFKQMNEMLKEDVRIVRGNTPDEMAKNVVNALGGKVEDGDEGGSASTIKDAIKEVMSFWDGEVECRVRNEYVYINKIKPPEDNYVYNLVEGLNIALDSVNITDYNPDTVNFLTVHWQGGEDIVYRDEKLIKRFGEKPLELDAVKKVTVTKTEEVSTSSSSSSSDSGSDSGSDSSSSGGDSSSSSSSDSSSSSGDSSSETETKTTTSIEEVPVETLEEAENFAKVEWAKIKRDDGHSLECKVMGSEKWLVGEWCHVILPSFDLDDFMYISKASQTESSDWGCNLSLVDYPPSFGEFKEESSDDEEEDIEDTEVSDDVSEDTTS